MLFGCPAWTVLKANLDALQTTERYFLRHMYRISKLDDEEHIAYISRATRHSEAVYKQVGGQSVIVAFLKRWINFVLEMFAKDIPGSNVRAPLQATIAWRSQLHWEILSSLASSGASMTTDPQAPEPWKHSIPGARTKAWEHPLVDWLGADWQTKIQRTPCTYVAKLGIIQVILTKEGYTAEKIKQMFNKKDADILEKQTTKGHESKQLTVPHTPNKSEKSLRDKLPRV